MRNLERWFDRNPVDVAYVSMLKHDAYVVTRAGRRKGFPVVLRPEGAGPTGDIAWQSWGNFGRVIGLACRRADAFVCISKLRRGRAETVAAARNDATFASNTILKASAQGPANDLNSEWSADPRIALAGAARLEHGPARHLRRPSRSRERTGYAHRRMAPGDFEISDRPTCPCG